MHTRYSLLFYLKDRIRSDGKRLLFLRVSIPTGGKKKPDGKYLPPKRFVYSTGLAIETKYFDKAKQKAKTTFNYATVFNTELDRLRNQISEIFARAAALNIDPETELIKAFKREKSKTGFVAYIEQFIEARRSTDSKGSITNYSATLNDLKTYESQNGVRLEFEMINGVFGEKFAKFLLDKGNGNNTIQKKLSFVKTFAADALNKELHSSVAFRQIKDSVFEAETSHIALTRAEVTSLWNFEFETERLSKVRDAFCFMVFTGLRFSDYQQLQTAHLQTAPDGAKYLSFVIQKTSKPHTLGLNRFAAELWERYEGNLPKITNQKFNEYLKEVCKLADINTPTETVTFKGAERIKTLQPKYELVSAHTARRTFASLSDEMGVSLVNLQKQLGHHDTAQTELYLKRTALERASETVAIWDKMEL